MGGKQAYNGGDEKKVSESLRAPKISRQERRSDYRLARESLDKCSPYFVRQYKHKKERER